LNAEPARLCGTLLQPLLSVDTCGDAVQLATDQFNWQPQARPVTVQALLQCHTVWMALWCEWKSLYSPPRPTGIQWHSMAPLAVNGIECHAWRSVRSPMHSIRLNWQCPSRDWALTQPHPTAHLNSRHSRCSSQRSARQGRGFKREGKCKATGVPHTTGWSSATDGSDF